MSGPREVLELERRLLGPMPVEEADGVLHADFREFGASGRVWDRAAALGELGQRRQPVEPRDLAVAEVADGVALVTYTSTAA